MFGEDGWRSGGTLERLTRDLVSEARTGRLEPVRCRDDEVARVIDILLRHGKNNPVLVGPAGVGKTAIAEGLAQRIAAGAVPLALRDVRLLALDHVSMLAGTMYRGQYEERLQALVREVSRDPNIILFVDELHNLIGQGTAVGVAMDAANMLKPSLVRGEFRVIGATTDDEYERWICGDPALERRFQRVPVRELSAEQTLEILAARRERLERHHNVAIAEEAMVAAVRLTDLFVTERARPDRAIDALDEACAHTQATATYSPALERLIARRRELLRHAPAETRQAGEPSSAEAPGQDELDDPFERMARQGFAALERFGAEIEAALSGVPVTTDGEAPARGPATATTNGDHRFSNATSASPSRLAEVEAELNRLLVEEGFVVRGHDIARVVSMATGRQIQWSE
jgi:ATP-dependent Clp protease ATP-binding subunit ClpA